MSRIRYDAVEVVLATVPSPPPSVKPPLAARLRPFGAAVEPITGSNDPPTEVPSTSDTDSPAASIRAKEHT